MTTKEPTNAEKREQFIKIISELDELFFSKFSMRIAAMTDVRSGKSKQVGLFVELGDTKLDGQRFYDLSFEPIGEPVFNVIHIPKEAPKKSILPRPDERGYEGY